MFQSKEKQKTLVARGGLVAIGDLAVAIGGDKSNILKDLKRRGFALDKRRSREARGQFVSVIAVEDCKRYLGARDAELLGGEDGVVFREF